MLLTTTLPKMTRALANRRVEHCALTRPLRDVSLVSWRVDGSPMGDVMSLSFYPSRVGGVLMVSAVGHATPTRMFHEWYSVTLNLQGSSPLHYRQRVLEAARNRVAILEPGELHYNSVIRSPLDAVVANIDVAVFHRVARQLGFARTPHFRVDQDPTPPYVAAAVADFALQSHAEPEIAESALSNMVAALLEGYAEARPKLDEVACQRAFDAVVETARYGRICPSTSELAALEGVSERQVHRAFSKAFGLSPVEVFQLVRVTRVLVEAESVDSLPQLAASCGFADQSHMNRVFRRVAGYPVGKYAKRLRSTTFGDTALAPLRASLRRAAGRCATRREAGVSRVLSIAAR